MGSGREGGRGSMWAVLGRGGVHVGSGRKGGRGSMWAVVGRGRERVPVSNGRLSSYHC